MDNKFLTKLAKPHIVFKEKESKLEADQHRLTLEKTGKLLHEQKGFMRRGTIQAKPHFIDL
jgi:hypothetical protein